MEADVIYLKVPYSHMRIYYWTGGLILLSWISLALVDPDPAPGSGKTLVLGYFLGSLFAHATLAAAWSALGPGLRSVRVPLSLVWVIALPVAIAINVTIHGGPNDAAVDLGVFFFCQWALLQFPL